MKTEQIIYILDKIESLKNNGVKGRGIEIAEELMKEYTPIIYKIPDIFVDAENNIIINFKEGMKIICHSQKSYFLLSYIKDNGTIANNEKNNIYSSMKKLLETWNNKILATKSRGPSQLDFGF